MNILFNKHMVDLASSTQSHRPIVDALASRQPERIRDAIRNHIEASYPYAMLTGKETS
ncbi:MAG: FCD domain-containing protein [Acidobacteria bacterium]|nr:FCD domain-containing protein [Acidobacteriota bacterium]